MKSSNKDRAALEKELDDLLAREVPTTSALNRIDIIFAQLAEMDEQS